MGRGASRVPRSVCSGNYGPGGGPRRVIGSSCFGRLDPDRQLVAVRVCDVRVPARIGLAFRDLFAPYCSARSSSRASATLSVTQALFS